MSRRIGVCAIQGDFAKHLEALGSLPDVEPIEVRTAEELKSVERLIIPGGESSTVGLLLHRYGLGTAIQEYAQRGLPVWGTCMGLILLAKHIESHEQYSLGLLDVTVRRNAFGAQVHSFIHKVWFEPLQVEVEAVFIRAPIVTEIGAGVQALARYEGEIVAAQEGRILGTSFHPELTQDRKLHEYFLSM